MYQAIITSASEVHIAALHDHLSADFMAKSQQASLEAGYAFSWQQGGLEPYAQLALLQLRSEGFGETGGASALVGEAQREQRLFSVLGARFTRAFKVASAFWLDAGWQHGWNSMHTERGMSLSGSAFNIRGLASERDAVLLSGGVQYGVGKGGELSAGLRTRLAQDTVEMGVNMAAKWRF